MTPTQSRQEEIKNMIDDHSKLASMPPINPNQSNNQFIEDRMKLLVKSFTKNGLHKKKNDSIDKFYLDAYELLEESLLLQRKNILDEVRYFVSSSDNVYTNEHDRKLANIYKAQILDNIEKYV